jgi:hypothetical protein
MGKNIKLAAIRELLTPREFLRAARACFHSAAACSRRRA